MVKCLNNSYKCYRTMHNKTAIVLAAALSILFVTSWAHAANGSPITIGCIYCLNNGGFHGPLPLQMNKNVFVGLALAAVAALLVVSNSGPRHKCIVTKRSRS
jgi:uncharacterized membrane protein YccC